MGIQFKLPVSSYEELTKIIRAYGLGKEGVPLSLDDLVKTSGMGKTVISKNNGFLVQIGLITDGSKKAPTELCNKLASAYEVNLNEEIVSIWRGVIDHDDFMSKIISVIRIKKKMTRSDYINHIIYSSGCPNNATYRAGAGAIIEILKSVGAVGEKDGEITTPDVEIGVSDNSGISKAENKEVVTSGARDTEKAKANEVDYFIQQYTCETGSIAKIVIPENATRDDLLGFREMLDISLKRKFKIEEY